MPVAIFARGEVTLLDTPNKSAQARYDLGSMVDGRYFLSTYILSENTAGLAHAGNMIDLADEGKEVFFLTDHFGAGHGPSRALLKSMIQAGVHVGLYHAPELFHPMRYLRRLHDKIVIVDSTHLITGDRNLSNEYFGLEQQPWKGMDIYVNSPTVAGSAERYFLELFNSPHVIHPTFPWITQKAVKAVKERIEAAQEFI